MFTVLLYFQAKNNISRTSKEKKNKWNIRTEIMKKKCGANAVVPSTGGANE